MHPPYHCPSCQALLTVEPEHLNCSSCQAQYVVHNTIPELISEKYLDDFKREEQHFHDELSESAQAGSVQHRNSEFHWHFKRPMLDLPAGSSILEVACGTRADGIELALTGKDVTSLDLSLDAVHHSKHLAEKNGAGASMRFLVADAEHLPFADHAFDACFVAASFHHFPNQDVALREMARVTKPGGYVIMGVEPAGWPYRTVYKMLAPVKTFIRQHRNRQHNSVADDSTTGYNTEQLHALFRTAGLQIIQIRRVKFFTEFYDSGTRMIGRLLHRNFRSSSTLDHVLARVDQALGLIPGVDRAYWHYNVISIVPSHVI